MIYRYPVKIHTNLSNELNSPIRGRVIGGYPTYIVNAHVRHIQSSLLRIYIRNDRPPRVNMYETKFISSLSTWKIYIMNVQYISCLLPRL